MAYVGLRKIFVAKWNKGDTYGEKLSLGKAIGITVTPSYAEGSLYADDGQAEYDKEFSYADVTFNTSTLPIKAHEMMFGHETEGETGVSFKGDDQAEFVGAAWISVEKVDGTRKYIGNFLTKVKFGEPSEDYATKGESIEYKTPSISGRASTNDAGLWKMTEICATEGEALSWIDQKFGVAAQASEAQEE